MTHTPAHRAAAAVLVLALGVPALAGGSPENALLIVNPASAQSLYLANYYKNARGVPDANVLYINPFAPNYDAFAGPGGNIEAVLGKLRTSKIDRQIDYIIVTDADTGFWIFVGGRITDQCSPVTRLSISSAYTLAFQRNRILAGNLPSTTTNQYFALGYTPLDPQALSSATRWLGGAPSTEPQAERYFIGAQLGWTGANGNTVPEIIAMIDRSVAADASRPAGTIYYVNNPADPLRNVRVGQFPPALSFLGPRAQQLNTTDPQWASALPAGRNDVLGVMTGAEFPDIAGTPFTMVNGAFADHLTSWAATFDINSQTKVSAWIRKGASGSAGTVEEPCNYQGKFPWAIFHAYYLRGLSLGEAYLRSMLFLPFQSLLIGDPLTRPFAWPPAVTPNFPSGLQSGVVQFTSSAAATAPGASVASLDLYVNGVLFSSVAPGQPFTLDTTTLPDGWNELRVLASDTTPQRHVGRAIGSIFVSNADLTASVAVNPPAGSMTTRFSAQVAAFGGNVAELRLIQNERVIGALPNDGGNIVFYGRNIGAGRSRLQAEAVFDDGRVARSEPVFVDVSFTAGTPAGQPPLVYSFTRRVPRGGATTIELPASFDDTFSNATWTIVTPPAQASINAGKGFATITPSLTASGVDTLVYRVTTPSGQSANATVALVYTPFIRSATRW